MRRASLCFASVLTALSFCLTVAGVPRAKNSSGQEKHPKTVVKLDVSIIPVVGPSWIEHLGRPFEETSMGKTGSLGPAPYGKTEGGPEWDSALMADLASKTIVVSGADLYRLDCEACHGPEGKGVPPEINSIIDPVRATSPELIIERMKKVGAPVSSIVARQLAAQAENSLRQRIAHGGQSMPPFPHLNEVEVRALITYLNQLAGVPGAEQQQISVEEPVAHVGEDLVKATCHICHSATGPNPSPQELLQGAIPPLAVLTTRLTLPQFVGKVGHGRPIRILGQEYRGRMPVFGYLSESEIAAAYLYLLRYPPQDVTSTH
jgi:mono/diheme cytochrome c family protein